MLTMADYTLPQLQVLLASLHERRARYDLAREFDDTEPNGLSTHLLANLDMHIAHVKDHIAALTLIARDPYPATEADGIITRTLSKATARLWRRYMGAEDGTS